MFTDPDPDAGPFCAICLQPCSKAIGARRQTVNTFWGGTTHGAKVFYTDDHTDYFCTEVHRTDFFYGPPRNDGGDPETTPGV